MNKNNLSIRYLKKIQRDLTTRAGVADLMSHIDGERLKEVFLLPSPARERAFVAGIFEKQYLARQAA